MANFRLGFESADWRITRARPANANAGAQSIGGSANEGGAMASTDLDQFIADELAGQAEQGFGDVNSWVGARHKKIFAQLILTGW